MVFWLAIMLLTGCGLIKIEEGERTPLEYTIVKQEEIPAEAVRFMEQKRKNGFQMIYKVEDSMYLMKGYGTQVTGGYSIQVEEVSQSEKSEFSVKPGFWDLLRGNRDRTLHIPALS